MIDMEALNRPFDAGQIKQREGRGGKMLDYIEAHAVIARLNEAFDGAWSFEVVGKESLEGEVVVHGRLTAGGQVKEQFGSSMVARNRETGKPICIGDDLKAAGSDALKKCATLFGVGLHLYDKTPAQRPTQPPQNGRAYQGQNGRQAQRAGVRV